MHQSIKISHRASRKNKHSNNELTVNSDFRWLTAQFPSISQKERKKNIIALGSPLDRDECYSAEREQVDEPSLWSLDTRQMSDAIRAAVHITVQREEFRPTLRKQDFDLPVKVYT